MKNPKIVFISANFRPTVCGIGDYTRHLASALAQERLEISVLTHRQGVQEKIAGFEVIELAKNWTVFAAFELQRALRKIKPDIVHLQYEPNGYHQSFSVPLSLCVQQSVPLVSTIHEVFHKYTAHRWRDRLLYHQSRALIVNDRGCLERMAEIEPTTLEKTTVIGVGSNIPVPARFQPRDRTDEEVRVGHFGFLNGARKFEILLEAVHTLVYRRGLKIRLLVIAPFDPKRDNYHRLFKNRVEQLQIKENVEFLGTLDEEQTARKLLTCDIAVLPFYDGASPRRGTFQACAALGLPIITTRPIFEVPLIKDRQTALLLSDINSSLLAEKIEELARNPDLANQLSAGALKYSENFEWSIIAQRHLEIYRDLLAAKPS